MRGVSNFCMHYAKGRCADCQTGGYVLEQMDEVKIKPVAPQSGARMQGKCVNESNQNLERRLARHPFLQGLEDQHIHVLAQSAIPTHFEKGQLIFRAGEPANGLYLIETGAVALEGSALDHGAITTDTVGAGEPLGWSWLFPPYLWHFDARAIVPTTAICLAGIALREHRDQDPELSHELFRRTCAIMARRLQAARKKLVVSHALNASAQLATATSPNHVTTFLE
jgi:CRP/FNR family cyclic AMP-dependent transcriptional regulator